ncbi:hypothetical protein [Algoriphagus namhaensis]
MSTIQYKPCEPFRAYNRLEGRPREEELDDALAAKINDPLWMMARQYQFGELRGEDAGSAIFAKVAINSVRLTEFTAGDGTKQAYSDDLPLETQVEHLIPKFDFRLAARLGKKFLSLLDEEGKTAPAAHPYSPGQYREALAVRFSFEVPDIMAGESAAITAKKARLKSLQQASAFLRTLAGRAVNGAEFWDFIHKNVTKVSELVQVGGQAPTTERFLNPQHKSLFQTAAQKWINFVREELNLPESDAKDSWFEERMEYSFSAAIDEGTGKDTELKAEEYFHGHLDWYSFDISAETEKSRNTPGARKREVLAGIPTEASFAGMPNSRWWEMEDGTIDLGNLKASDTDIAKILVTQYALQYSNDWLCIPYDIPTGSYAEVEGILVSDTFGLHFLVEAAHKAGNDWNEWNMYSLTKETEEFATPEFDKRILLPPSAVKTLESESLEEVKFIRDEMANMVWAIESRIPDGLGGGMDGYEAARNLESEFERLIEEKTVPETLALPSISLAAEPNKATTYKPQLRYQLGNSVSENWIPFVASHMQGSNREIHFQRASMPRIIEIFEPHAIRPRTQLLRVGINEEDDQLKPYYINEEEVPRAGVRVTGTYQRTRWYHGKIVSWYGRRKYTGRGEGSSGLRFDLVLDND